MKKSQLSFENFSNKAKLYAKYRPSYSEKYIYYLSLMGIDKSSIIADIGAGTGIHSKLLANIAQKVYCVEPNEEMAAECSSLKLEFPNIEIYNSTGENTLLPDNCLDYVMIAQAFHMLDQHKCKIEFQRILKQRGKVVLTWNSKSHDTLLFKDTEEVLHRYCSDYNRELNAPKLTPYTYEDFFKDGIYDFLYFKDDYSEFLDENMFIGRTLSASYSLTEHDVQYKNYVIALREIFQKHNVDNLIKISLNTTIYFGSLS